MKTTPVCLIVAGLMTPMIALAQSPDEPRPQLERERPDKRGPQRPFVEAWRAADKDGDGFISMAEFGAMPRIATLPEEKRPRLFERLDKDQDGRLGRDELGRMGRPQDGQGPPMQRLAELDLDKSGGVSLEEFKTGDLFQKLPGEKQLRIFQRLDTDRDGMITPRDKPEPPFKREGGKPDFRRPEGPGGKPKGPPMEPQRMFQQLDRNADGSLSFEEFRVAPLILDLSEDEQEDRFEATDKNRDQKLTPDELVQPLLRERGRKGEGRPEDGPPPRR